MINVIFYFACVFSTIETHLFIYPSLSRSLLMECTIMLLTLIAIMYAIVRRVNIVSDSLTIYLLCWITYVVVHGLLSPVMEVYRTLYLCISLFSIPSIAYLRIMGILARRNIENGVLLIAVIHVLYIMGQYMGVLSSCNPSYHIVGSNENPTVTAIYIVGCLPLIVVRLKEKRYKYFYFLLLSLCLFSLVCLKCRTAYIGLFVEIFIGIIFYVRKNKNSILITYKWTFLLLSLAIIVFTSLKLYMLKQDSADSRLLIWKLSTRMIV